MPPKKKKPTKRKKLTGLALYHAMSRRYVLLHRQQKELQLPWAFAIFYDVMQRLIEPRAIPFGYIKPDGEMLPEGCMYFNIMGQKRLVTFYKPETMILRNINICRK